VEEAARERQVEGGRLKGMANLPEAARSREPQGLKSEVTDCAISGKISDLQGNDI
jgi:hypothetical protein